MSKVAITKSKLDTLANAIAAAASTPAPLTIDQMTTAAGTLVKPVWTLQDTEVSAEPKVGKPCSMILI